MPIFGSTQAESGQRVGMNRDPPKKLFGRFDGVLVIGYHHHTDPFSGVTGAVPLERLACHELIHQMKELLFVEKTGVIGVKCVTRVSVVDL